MKEVGEQFDSKFCQETIRKNTKIYSNKNQAFPALLGGIGTGNISLDGDGRLCDFEVMGHAEKGFKVPYSFFALYSRFEGEAGGAWILEAAPTDVCTYKGMGRGSGELYGLPRMDTCTIKTNYPYFVYHFQREGLPLDITMEAFTPFIPLDTHNSGIPGFICRYRVKNTSEKKAQVSICGSMYNFTGMVGWNGYDGVYLEGKPVNQAFSENGLTGVSFYNEGVDDGAVNYGTLALASSNRHVSLKPNWLDTGWFDGPEEFWQDFTADGCLDAEIFLDAVTSQMVSWDVSCVCTVSGNFQEMTIF